MMSSLLALTIPVLVNPLKANADDYRENSCRRAVVGTYLATSTQGNSTNQPSTNREVITFTADGNLIANDSNAGGIPGSSNPVDQPFGSLQGSWKCIGNNKIVAKAINFSYASGSLPTNITVVEYQLTFNPQAGTVSGNGSFNFYDINSNPLDPNTQPSGEPFQFSYQGLKVKAN
jgi:hypothetical protein